MNSTPTIEKPRNERKKPGHGAVAILAEEQKFLVIRRSAKVRAPNLICFAGGTIEVGETPSQTIVRELEEELGLKAIAKEHVWQSRTAWGTLLEWIVVDRLADSQPVANQDEVSEWMWVGAEELLLMPDLLPSVPAFFTAWAHNEFCLPPHAGPANPAWRTLPPPKPWKPSR